jgi:regulator of replication initiation timing
MSNEVPIKKRTLEEKVDYLVMQYAIMRVELDQLQKKLGLKEPPKPFKKKPPKEQKSL